MAQRTKRLLLSKPFSSEEKFVKYVEFVADNGGVLPELQNEGRHISFFVYHNIDIFIPFVLVLITASYVLVKSSVFIIKSIFVLFMKKPLSNKMKKQ